MLQDFLLNNREALIDRCRTMGVVRSGPKLSSAESVHGIPVFLDQIIETLMVEQLDSPHGIPPTIDDKSDVGVTATLHGRDLLEEGFTLEQVIRDYGDVCQAVTSLASEIGAPISAGEFHTFNRCLDDAIAAAVTEYSRRKSVESASAASAGAHPSASGVHELDHLESALNQSQLALAFTEAALTAAQLEAHEAHTRSLHDSLTGLPNRELFDDRLTQAISLANRHDLTLAVMFLDLDEFKNINDVHGHEVGDAVLRRIAERLRDRVRDEDTVCRNGGDEFLYLLMNPGSRDNLERIAHSIASGIAQPVAVGQFEFAVKPSIGIAIYPGDGCAGNDLIANADSAMYRAKRLPHGVVLFDQQETDLPDGS